MFIYSKKIVAAVAAAVLSLTGGLAGADTTIDCVLDGYVAMGGMVFNTSNSYLLPGNPDSEPSGTMETFGYSFLKFETSALPGETVSNAQLVLDVIALQDGMSWPADGTGSIGVFAVSADVESLTAANCGNFRNSITDISADSLSVTGAGTISLDITDLLNGWITSGNNYGLVLASPGGLMPRLSSSESVDGIAPYVSVPEPATISLMLLGAATVAARRKKSL